MIICWGRALRDFPSLTSFRESASKVFVVAVPLIKSAADAAPARSLSEKKFVISAELTWINEAWVQWIMNAWIS